MYRSGWGRRSGSMVILAATVATPPALGQAIPFSQHGTVSQRVSLTDITIEYNRPVARGRDIFGALVPWGKIWHPGADSATTISLSLPVEVAGHRVPAGRYSLWILPREAGPWTVIFSRAAAVFHTPFPGPEHDLLRIEVAPEYGPHMETMAFYFPVVDRDRAVLRFHWAEVVLPLHIVASGRGP